MVCIVEWFKPLKWNYPLYIYIYIYILFYECTSSSINCYIMYVSKNMIVSLAIGICMVHNCTATANNYIQDREIKFWLTVASYMLIWSLQNVQVHS